MRAMTLLFGLSVGSAAVINAPPAATSALKLRGGLMDIDGAQVAKYAVLLNGVDAGLSTISGAKGWGDIVEGWTDGALAAAVGYYLFADAILGGGDTSKAVVLGALPGLVGAVKGWLNGGKKVDLSGSNVSLLIKAFLTYCLHTGTILEGDLALQIVAGFGIVNGLGGMFAPDLVAKLPWDGSASPATCAGVGAAVYALTTGASATQAFAYSVVPALVQSLQGIGDSDDMGKLVTLIQAAVVATNLA